MTDDETMEDFTSGRVNPLKEIGDGGLQSLLTSVVNAFSLEWLTRSPTTNRIQELWGRRDAVATNQLAILGSAIELLSDRNAAWVSKRIDAIKSETTSGDRKGDLFEVLGLSLFQVEGQTVMCAAENTPGYDGVIDFGGGALASVSVKDFGMLYFEKQFLEKSSEIELILRGLPIQSLGLVITASRYPLTEDWKRLRNAIEGAVTRLRHDVVHQEIGIWSLRPQALPVNYNRIVDVGLSYAVVITSPHHQNEQKNVLSKIESACANLSKHARKFGDGRASVLLGGVPIKG